MAQRSNPLNSAKTTQSQPTTLPNRAQRNGTFVNNQSDRNRKHTTTRSRTTNSQIIDTTTEQQVQPQRRLMRNAQPSTIDPELCTRHDEEAGVLNLAALVAKRAHDLNMTGLRFATASGLAAAPEEEELRTATSAATAPTSAATAPLCLRNAHRPSNNKLIRKPKVSKFPSC